MTTSSAGMSLPSLSIANRTATWLEKCQQRLSRSNWLTVALLFAFTSIVAAIDYASGDDVPLMVLYLPAIIAACWLQSLSIGVAMSLVCSCLWLVDDIFLIEQTDSITHKYWLAVIHLMFFSVVAVMTWRLRLAQEREQYLARTDALTQLANRKAFFEAAQREIARSNRTASPLAVAYLDCDNFKQVNDTLGHAAGDALLIAVAQTATASVRPTDTVARLGGDEFACLLPAADDQQAGEILRRVHQQLDAAMRQNDWPVTFSIGLAVFTHPPVNLDELISLADQLMYEVKSGAKNSLLIRKMA